MSMHFDPPTDLEVLEYAKEGLIMKIGSHPAPREYPEEIAEYEAHLKEVERMLRLNNKRLVREYEQEYAAARAEAARRIWVSMREVPAQGQPHWEWTSYPGVIRPHWEPR